MTAGSTVYFRKSENPSTGYSLIVDSTANGIYEYESRYESAETLAPYLNEPLVGAGGERIYQLHGLTAGTSTFRLAYARIWEY